MVKEFQDYLLGFFWGCALTIILFLVFINKGIENTKVKVDRAYVEGYTDMEKKCGQE